MLAITQCPICQGKNFSEYLHCTDYTVSHETFTIVKCNSCGFLLTSPRPNDSDLGKYYLSDDYISHSNKSTSLVDQIYKISRSFTLKWKINLVKSNLNFNENATPRLLDFGCGTGEFLLKSKQHGFHVTGVEPSSIARDQATSLIQEKVSPDITNAEGTFDVITLWHVLEHIPDLNTIIEQLRSRLSKNGTMFIAVPNHQSLDAKIYKAQWAGYDVPRHLWHFNQATMTMLLKNHSLKLEKVIPMKLDAFYVSLLSEKYRNNKNSLAGMTSAFLNGIKSNRTAKTNKEFSSLIYIARK